MDLRILDAIHHKLALIAKVQAMRGANETRRARGAADAYDEGAFIEAADLADAALRATLDREIEARHAAEEATANHREHALRTVAAEADLARLRAAATLALAVLTRLADSAAYWSDYDVPVGIVAEIDEAKARLAGALSREARP